MSIVLNEVIWAKEIESCAHPSLGKKPFETLSRMATHYKYEGLSKKDARDALDVFLLRCDPDANIVSWSNTLDQAVKAGFKYKPLELDGVSISTSEMAKVDALKSKQTKRLAFTLLCLAKYWNAYKPGNNNWVRTPDSDIMRMADIRTSVKRQCGLFRELNNCGYIRFSRQVDNLNVQVLFMDNGEPVLTIHNFDHLGYQYLKYHGDPYYYECCYCGATAKRKNLNSRPPKYCPNCAEEVARQGRIASAIRHRTGLPS